MLIDLSALLFPSGEVSTRPNRFHDTQYEESCIEELEFAKILALAFLQTNWLAGLGFVTRFTKKIEVMALSQNHWLSSSSASEPCTIKCTVDARYLAESVEGLIHEASHLAIYRLERFSSLQMSKERVYSHPWKRDLREARGALLAAHAFLNVSEWYLRLAARAGSMQFADEAQRMLQGVAGVLAQLESGRNLSTLGNVICTALSERFCQLTKEDLLCR